jgi:hypothetical protein
MLCSILVACALAAGCASMHPRIERTAKRLDCDGGKECAVPVNVACTLFYGCDLWVDYDVVVVNTRGSKTEIVWRLAGDAGATFAANGIVLEDTEFECKARSDREFACTDKHADFGVFKYRVNVSVRDGPFGPRGVPSLDPWIVNR